MTRRWTRRALLQAGATAVAAPIPRPRLPRPVRVGLIGLEGHYSEVLEAADLVPEIQVAAVATSGSQGRKPRRLRR